MGGEKATAKTGIKIGRRRTGSTAAPRPRQSGSTRRPASSGSAGSRSGAAASRS